MKMSKPMHNEDVYGYYGYCMSSFLVGWSDEQVANMGMQVQMQGNTEYDLCMTDLLNNFSEENIVKMEIVTFDLIKRLKVIRQTLLAEQNRDVI